MIRVENTNVDTKVYDTVYDGKFHNRFNIDHAITDYVVNKQNISVGDILPTNKLYIYSEDMKYITKAYIGINGVASEISLKPVIHTGMTMTVKLDVDNDDPGTWASYADDAVDMTPGDDSWDEFFGHYPCILNNGVELGKLNPNNFAQYENGPSAPISDFEDGNNVMIAFPNRGVRVEYVVESEAGVAKPYIIVSMTDIPGRESEGYSYLAHSYNNQNCDKFYIGAYMCGREIDYSADTSIWFSLSGKTIYHSDLSPDIIRSQISTKYGGYYGLSSWYQLIFRQAMYLLKYKGQDAQAVIGKGCINGGAPTTGSTNSAGMDYGTQSYQERCKLFGIEDFYGNFADFVDNIYSDTSTLNINVSDFGGGNKRTILNGMNTGTWLHNVYGGNAGFIGRIDSGGSKGAYFCDYVGVSSYRKYFVHGGYRNISDDEAVGVFNLTTLNNNQFYPDIGYRLMYMKPSNAA